MSPTCFIGNRSRDCAGQASSSTTIASLLYEDAHYLLGIFDYITAESSDLQLVVLYTHVIKFKRLGTNTKGRPITKTVLAA